MRILICSSVTTSSSSTTSLPCILQTINQMQIFEEFENQYRKDVEFWEIYKRCGLWPSDVEFVSPSCFQIENWHFFLLAPN
jgi:hypothetical protein